MKLFSAALNAALLAALSLPAAAQDSYREPPQVITDIVLRPPPPGRLISPDGKTILFTRREALPAVAELAADKDKAAGIQFDPATSDFAQTRGFVGLTLQDIASGEQRQIVLPEDVDLRWVAWSPDSRKIALVNRHDSGLAVQVFDIASGTFSTLLDNGASIIFGLPQWLGSDELLVLSHSENRGERPERPLTPAGPRIQDAAGGDEAHIRTYQNLLSDPHDENLFDWHVTTQPAVLPIDGSPMRRIAPPQVYTSITPSPDGQYVLLEWVKRPYSYQTPYYRFPTSTAIYAMDGEFVRLLHEAPATEDLPVGGVYAGPRNHSWHNGLDATALWVEAQDGGDPRVETQVRDHVLALPTPFTGEARLLHALEDRYTGLTAIQDSDDLIVADYDRDTREFRQTLVDAGGSDPARVLSVHNRQDSYADPGRFVSIELPSGRSVVRKHGNSLYLTGPGATPEGFRPFLNRLDLATLETTELWRNSGQQYEEVIELLEPDASRFITSLQTPTVPVNYYLHEPAGVRKLTDFTDPHPELTGIKSELVTYTRSDGVELSAKLYLPPNYKEGDKLPVIVWAYPREFNDAATASQVRGSPYFFTRIGGFSHLFLLTQGYAVLDGAAMPVVGSDPETVNDTFLSQIVASAQAVVDFTVERGFGDGWRVGVGGHSYGAFMTANLLAHSDVFRAGIAQSGAYNRTLTPFGFQSERRIFWDAREVYYNLSPFMVADRINEPLLLIHGADDSNPGTYPMQSERMFAAVKGTGGEARLVMLPHEDHGYRGRESVLHTLAEQVEWFDRYVKNAAPSDD